MLTVHSCLNITKRLFLYTHLIDSFILTSKTMNNINTAKAGQVDPANTPGKADRVAASNDDCMIVAVKAN